MSQFHIHSTSGGGGGDVNTLEGNTGGPVGPDVTGNIHTIGDEITTTVVGTPGNNTLTVSTLFNPNQVVELVEEFMVGDQWAPYGTTGGISSLSGHPGLIQFFTPGDDFAGIRYAISGEPTAVTFVLGGGAIESHFVFSLNVLSDVTNTYDCYIGFGDQNIAEIIPTPPDSGIYFYYKDTVNGGRWQAICKNATVATTVDTGVSAITGFMNFGYQINALGTSVTFLINGVSVATIATNIPTNVYPFICEFRSSGDLPLSIVDMWSFRQILTVAR